MAASGSYSVLVLHVRLLATLYLKLYMSDSITISAG